MTSRSANSAVAAAVYSDAEAFRDFEYRWWESAAAVYDEYFGQLTRLMTVPLLDGVCVRHGMSVLDVATGPGYVAAAAAKRGAIVTGLDFSEKMISRARTLNVGADIRFDVGNAESLPYPSERFDVVVMNFGVLHLAQPERAMQEARRVLKPGGLYAFTVWARPEEAVGFAIVLKAIEEFGNSNVPLPAGPPFFRFSDPIECESALDRAGFVDTTFVKVPLVWRLPSSEAFFKAFYEGTARTGAVLRAQTSGAIGAIREAILRGAEKFLTNGKLNIPAPALVVTARK